MLTEKHDGSQFSCGKPSLDHWLKTRALSNQRRGFTVVMVVHEAGRVVGYFGLAPTAVVPSTLPRSVRTGQPPDPVPWLLLGQLATDTAWAGRGVATGGRASGARERVDAEAARWWRARGFVPTKDDALLLFRSVADIAASVGAAD